MKVEKELSEMSLNELWELFPIFLVEHNDKWDAFYSEMEAKLQYNWSCPEKWCKQAFQVFKRSAVIS